MAEQRRNLAHVCPDAETLAAYLDGRLTGHARSAVTEHLAECEDCYFIFTESARERLDGREIRPVPRPWRVFAGAPRWAQAAIVTGGLAAAASLTLVVQPQIASRLFGRSDVAELVAAVGSERNFEPRLTGGFAYAPVTPVPVVRSGEPADDRISPDVRIAALKLEQRLKSDRTAANLRAYAAAELVVGRSDRAVSSLEEAARLLPHDPRLQSDLAAAYLVRFKDRNNLEDVTRAVGAATDATERDPKLREARFNLALALESLSLREEARKAWQAYLAIDGSSPWAAEARQHLDALAPEKQSKRYDEEHQQVVDAAASGDPARALAIAKRLPDTAYDYVENELIPAWADAWLAGEHDNANDLLLRARVMSDALASAVGERMPADAVANIGTVATRDPSAGDALARAYRDFRAARATYEDGRIADAAVQFSAADAIFLRQGSPSSEWTTLYRCVASYYRGDLTAAAVPLDQLIRAAHVHAHNVVEGRSLRMRGLLNGLGGKLADSLDDYRSALLAFGRVDAREDLAAIHWVLSDRLVTIGDMTTAWQHMHLALRNLDAVRRASPRNGILFSAGSTARKQGELQAALAFQSEFLDGIANEEGNVDAPQAFLARADISRQLGNVDTAAADVSHARTLVEQIADVNFRERMRAEAGLALGELTDGPDAIESLTATLAYFEPKGMKQRLLRVYQALGRIHVQRGETREAEAAFRRGVSLLEAERALLPAGQVRIGYYEQPWNLYDDLIDVLASREEARAEALQVAERARARDLRENAGDEGIEDPQTVGRALPAGTVLVYFVLLDQRLLTWTLQRTGTRVFDEPVDRLELVNDANEFGSAIRDLRDADVERLSEHLFAHLFQPILGELAGAATIVVAADGPLHAIPFSALKDPVVHRYLIEDHAVVAAPSATVFSRAVTKLRAARSLQNARVFVVANPALDPRDASDLPNLPSAEQEGRDIKGLYPDATVLTAGRATKERFAAAGQFDIVHFAGHAVANDQYPLLSRLLFARDADGRPGTMFAHELLGIDFQNTELVVLAACRTGAGPIRRSEGPMSLARPFLARGVPIVIATLWDVADQSSAPLVNALYAGLRSGAAPGEALRNAQLMLLHHADSGLRRPAAWAAFVNFGGVA